MSFEKLPLSEACEAMLCVKFEFLGKVQSSCDVRGLDGRFDMEW